MEQLIIGYLLPILGSFLAVVVSILATYVTKWLMRKVGREMTKDQEDAMNKAIEEAIWAAEERAARELKSGNMLKEATGKMKYGFVLNLIGSRFPTLSMDEAKLKVNAVLGKTPGLGASAKEECECEEKKQDVRSWKVINEDLPEITP